MPDILSLLEAEVGDCLTDAMVLLLLCWLCCL